MHRKISKDELIKKATSVKNFVVTKGLNSNELIDLSSTLKEHKKAIVEIYWMNGADTRNFPSFESIRMKPRFVVMGGDIRSVTDGLIFPQSKPIILLIENFNRFPQEDQNKFLERICKKEKHDYYPNYYLHEESIVIIDLDKDSEEPKISYKLEVRVLE